MLIQLDLTKITTIDQLFDLFDEKFGFPTWFGRNYNALADCLFTFYFPEENLCEISNKNGTDTVLECIATSTTEGISLLSYIAEVLAYVNLKLSATEIEGKFALRPVFDAV